MPFRRRSEHGLDLRLDVVDRREAPLPIHREDGPTIERDVEDAAGAGDDLHLAYIELEGVEQLLRQPGGITLVPSLDTRLDRDLRLGRHPGPPRSSNLTVESNLPEPSGVRNHQDTKPPRRTKKTKTRRHGDMSPCL